MEISTCVWRFTVWPCESERSVSNLSGTVLAWSMNHSWSLLFSVIKSATWYSDGAINSTSVPAHQNGFGIIQRYVGCKVTAENVAMWNVPRLHLSYPVLASY